jgi:ActR/RegA family two-component response regulator
MTNPGRVLVVDDEENVALTLQAVLQREGYEVDTANSPEQAQRLIAEQQYSAALIDLRFGDVDGGLEILSALNGQQPSCMAVMLTGFASLESAIEAEVRRLESLGARRKRQVKTWWVMEDPAGQAFCVVPVHGATWPAGAVEWP